MRTLIRCDEPGGECFAPSASSRVSVPRQQISTSSTMILDGIPYLRNRAPKTNYKCWQSVAIARKYSDFKGKIKTSKIKRFDVSLSCIVERSLLIQEASFKFRVILLYLWSELLVTRFQMTKSYLNKQISRMMIFYVDFFVSAN